MQYARAVKKDDVGDTGGHEKLRDRRAGRARAAHHHSKLHRFSSPPSRHSAAPQVRQSRCRVGRHASPVYRVLQRVAFRYRNTGSTDIFEINTAEARRDGFHRAHYLVESCVSSTSGHASMPCFLFKNKRLPLHHRQSAIGANVPETEHRGTVGNDSDTVLFYRHLPRILRMFREMRSDATPTPGVYQSEKSFFSFSFTRAFVSMRAPCFLYAEIKSFLFWHPYEALVYYKRGYMRFIFVYADRFVLWGERRRYY